MPVNNATRNPFSKFATVGEQTTLMPLLSSIKDIVGRSAGLTRDALWRIAPSWFQEELYLSARRYVPAGMTAATFFAQLSWRNVRYVALRWFENLPNVDPGEDIDLLIADDDLSILEKILHPDDGSIPCDLYTVSGLPGTDYKTIPYYPPYLAEQILERRVLYNGHFSAPSPGDYFLSLAYHAVYHKGLNSGVPTSLRDLVPCEQPEHDYVDKLRTLASQCGLSDVDITMDSLEDYLADHGWRPPLDALARLAPSNQWVAERFFANTERIDPIFDGLVVFVLRERVAELQAEPEIIEMLRGIGFNIMSVKHLQPHEASSAAQRIRGGNWGRGPFPTSGGGPKIVVVGHDSQPVGVTDAMRGQHPLLENGRIPAAKEAIRKAINDRLRASQQCNVIHSSDNSQHALEYLRITMPEREDEIIQLLHNLSGAANGQATQLSPAWS
jgi:hypothetical protein